MSGSVIPSLDLEIAEKLLSSNDAIIRKLDDLLARLPPRRKQQPKRTASPSKRPLTPEQRKAVEVVTRLKSFQAAADELGISRQAVTDRYDGAVLKLEVTGVKLWRPSSRGASRRTGRLAPDQRGIADVEDRREQQSDEENDAA